MEVRFQKAFERTRGSLIRISREVAERGYSYRGFKVGAALLAWRPEGIGLNEKFRVFKAANVKPLANFKNKFCAEMTSACTARSHGYERIIAIAIAGLPQPDGESGLEFETLHPCEDCRIFLPSLPETTRDTYIVTVNNHNGIVRDFTLEEILKIHHSPIPWEAAA